MIEGLRLRVTSDELRSHMIARAQYHRSRADTKEGELPKLEEALRTISHQPQSALISNMSKGSYGFDPESQLDSLKADIQSHRNHTAAFEWMAGHLFAEDYNLQESDLKRLQILK